MAAAMDTSHEEVVGLDVDEDRPLDIVAADGARRRIRAKDAWLSKLLKTALEGTHDRAHTRTYADPEATEVHLSHVPSGRVLGFIAEYLEHHKGVVPEPLPYPVQSRDMRENTKDAFDANLSTRVLEAGVRTTVETVVAANYMDIASLMDLLCAAQATRIKGVCVCGLHSHAQAKRFPGSRNTSKSAWRRQRRNEIAFIDSCVV